MLLVQVISGLIFLSSCEFSGESDYLITMNCGDLVTDFKSRLESSENLDILFADLEYGVMGELEDFVKKLLVLLANTTEVTFMNQNNELSTNSQLAKTFSLFLPLQIDIYLLHQS